MRFLPAFEICLTDSAYTGSDSIQVIPGQWVTCDGSKGRVIDPVSFSVCWRMRGESFSSFNLRFKKSLSLRKGLKIARAALRSIYTVRNQLSMPLEENPVLQASAKEVHLRINRLRVLLARCQDKASAFPVNSSAYVSYHEKAYSCARQIAHLRSTNGYPS
jgi:hypothetical protein